MAVTSLAMAIALLSMPALTIATAAGGGGRHAAYPANGWPAAANNYLTGALQVSFAEETAWAGLVQTRLAARHGTLHGALRTAPLFAAMHLPAAVHPRLDLEQRRDQYRRAHPRRPALRYVIDNLLESTGGSLLAVGLWHASFNASRCWPRPPWRYDNTGGWARRLCCCACVRACVRA
jgi:membrane protease YdiL (CAAX protease family)